jgi:hypothetical protein
LFLVVQRGVVSGSVAHDLIDPGRAIPFGALIVTEGTCAAMRRGW